MYCVPTIIMQINDLNLNLLILNSFFLVCKQEVSALFIGLHNAAYWI